LSDKKNIRGCVLPGLPDEIILSGFMKTMVPGMHFPGEIEFFTRTFRR
jgi:hypothetical protein